MLVHRKKRPRYAIHVPLTSLIDIVFLLLVYFLLTTNFMVDEGMDIRLPKAQASRPQVNQEVIVYIDKDGKTFLQEKEVGLEELSHRVSYLLSQAMEKIVVVKADRNVVLDKAVNVMDVIKAAGAEKLVLATERPGQN